jgi:hypothetical protein
LLRPGDRGDPAEQQCGPDEEEGHDGGDLQQGEPELELAEVAHAREVDGGEDGHEGQGHEPDRQHREDRREEARSAEGFGRDHHHELAPPEPAHGRAGHAAERLAGVHGERAAVRIGGGHLAEGPHHDDDEGSRDEVREEDGGAGRLDAGSRADEEACPDRAAEPHHRELAR